MTNKYEYDNFMNIDNDGIKQTLESVDLEPGSETYIDPDMSSQRLYQTLAPLYAGRKLPNGFTITDSSVTYAYGSYGLRWDLVDENGDNAGYVNLGADYIGPSRYWARKIGGMNSEGIRVMLLSVRTIGGENLLPRNMVLDGVSTSGRGGTLNTGRGGRPLFDRMDYFLKFGSDFYDGKPVFLREFAKFESFFALFNDFTGYIDFFDLEGWVVDAANGDYRVVNLETNDPFGDVDFVNHPELLKFPDESTINAYVENTTTRIMARTRNLMDKLNVLNL